MSPTDPMIISFQGEVASVHVPKEENQQVVMIVITGEATDIYLNGRPVDPDTGEVDDPTAQSGALVEAADEIVKAFQDGTWKIGSPSFKKVDAAVKAYEAIRNGNEPPETTSVDIDVTHTADSATDQVPEP